jgi:hypothetical protein
MLLGVDILRGCINGSHKIWGAPVLNLSVSCIRIFIPTLLLGQRRRRRWLEDCRGISSLGLDG